ncbi:HNH endonuclease signature motif containing protein [Mycolicibacterium fluoranthenivorans]|uniref:HNH nuclease domain-containing protein n=1 Tax=Mycolicibacterium fluoranthenivorans TaxID=258505 RepID=A0A1G4VAP7_9MYCO|nr:HNH endonuclease signature motif containing protein [Mycolicibacterium fluoranthenivorans]SCX03819.1 protein of unknown function [Mycolicibacterium fluoranthenivorans]
MFDSHLATAHGELRAERAATARRLIALGHYTGVRMAELGNTHQDWVVDDWELVAVEVATELGIGRQRASTEMAHGRTLIERLPRLAQVFLAGDLEYGHFTAIAARTALIVDPDLLGIVDERVAAQAPGWAARSRDRVAELVDWLVLEVDPEAIRVAKQRRAERRIDVTPAGNGLADVIGTADAADAAVFDKRLDELARTVCPNDPRTHAERRADALRALSEGATRLACMCGSAECPAATAEAPAGSIVIHVLAEQATVEGDSETPGLLPGYGAIPAEQVRQMAARARCRPVPRPPALSTEPGYRPSARLADFVRARDLTCRWYGCNAPAEVSDIDHTVPWPAGVTHPSNTKLYCRTHHLVKTFFPGWADVQGPDGSLTLISPTGRVYQSTPDGALFFPQLAARTGVLARAQAPPPTPARGLAMPTRARPRAHERAYRIARERALNRARAEANPPPF